MHFKGREARFPMLVWPGTILKLGQKEEVERENRTEPMAQSRERKVRTLVFRIRNIHIGNEK